MTDRLRSTLVLLLIAQVVLLCGCDPWKLSTSKKPLVPENHITADQLARELCLRIVSRSTSSLQMSDKSNTVMIFAGPLGQVYVNAKAIGAPGSVIENDSILYIPVGLKDDILSNLKYHRTSSYRVPQRIEPVYSPPKAPVFYLGPVVLDPGHGGRFSGAVGVNGLNEKDVNLAVALKAAEILRSRGVDVRLTREGDTPPEPGNLDSDLNSRAAFADECGAELFVSIHADSAANKAARGYTVYIPRSRVEQARPLAWKLANNMQATRIASRGVRPAGFRVLMKTSCPAVLVEMGFLSNRMDSQLLATEKFRSICAMAIADAVYDILK